MAPKGKLNLLKVESIISKLMFSRFKLEYHGNRERK